MYTDSKFCQTIHYLSLHDVNQFTDILDLFWHLACIKYVGIKGNFYHTIKILYFVFYICQKWQMYLSIQANSLSAWHYKKFLSHCQRSMFFSSLPCVLIKGGWANLLNFYLFLKSNYFSETNNSPRCLMCNYFVSIWLSNSFSISERNNFPRCLMCR